MIILCIWPFEAATVNIGYCSGYFKNIVKYFKLVSLLIACMNACLGRVPPRSKSLLVCLNVLAFQFPEAKEPRSPGETPCDGPECLNALHPIFLSDQLAFPNCGILYECISFSTYSKFLQEPV